MGARMANARKQNHFFFRLILQVDLRYSQKLDFPMFLNCCPPSIHIHMRDVGMCVVKNFEDIN